jgi:hypothetical protein
MDTKNDKCKGKGIRTQTGQPLRLPGILDTQHRKAAELSALRNDRLYPKENVLVLISVRD